MDDLDLSKKLVSALIDTGMVYARHGAIYDGNWKELMTEEEMVEALRLCRIAGIRVERVDGGGHWAAWKLFS